MTPLAWYIVAAATVIPVVGLIIFAGVIVRELEALREAVLRPRVRVMTLTADDPDRIISAFRKSLDQGDA